MSQPIPANPNGRLRTAAVISGLVGMIILVQVATRQFGTGSLAAKAGIARGDIRLNEDAIPTEVHDWNVVAFQEPKEGDTADGIGWAHSWTFQKNQRKVVVSFDQVGFMDWHELTQCYQATGCTLADRKVMSGKKNQDANDWGYVQATLMEASGEQDVLMYSIFNGLGEPVEPPGSTLPEKSNGFFDRLSPKNGLKLGTNPESSRCLQVQLLIPGGKEISDEDHAALEQLHFQTREIFRQHWMKVKVKSK